MNRYGNGYRHRNGNRRNGPVTRTGSTLALRARTARMAAAVLLLVAGAGAWAQERGPAERQAASGTVAAYVEGDPRFETFAAIVEVAELDGLLRTASMITVFAPTQEAFAQLPEATVETLRSDAEAARAFVMLHLIVDDIISMSGGRLVGNGSVNPVARVVGLPESLR